MEKKTLINKVPILVKQRNLTAILLLIMILGNFLLIINLIKKQETIIIMPSEFSDTYKISGKKVNDIYLQDRASEIIKVILNVTPSNIDIMHEKILKAVPSKNHFQLKKELRKLTKEIRSRNVSSAFYPLSIETNDQNLSVVISGELYTFFGGTYLKQKKQYKLNFTHTGSQLLLLEFIEITNNKNEKN